MKHDAQKNRGILAEFGWSTYTLNTLYFVLYISNISKWNTTRPKKPMIEKRMTYLYLFVLVPNYHEIIWERNCEKKRCTPLVFIQVKENLETTFFLLFFHFFYTAINVIKTVLNCVVSFKVHEKSRTLIVETNIMIEFIYLKKAVNLKSVRIGF